MIVVDCCVLFVDCGVVLGVLLVVVFFFCCGSLCVVCRCRLLFVVSCVFVVVCC